LGQLQGQSTEKPGRETPQRDRITRIDYPWVSWVVHCFQFCNRITWISR